MRDESKRRSVIVLTAAIIGICLRPATGLSAEGSAKPVSKTNASVSEGTPASTKVELKKHFPTKQLEKAEDVKWTHAPYNVGKCSLCHESDDHEKPGVMKAPVNTLCLSCHKKEKIQLKKIHAMHKPVGEDCGFCHNAHNAKEKALLFAPMETLCVSCHTKEGKALAAKTQHEPVIKLKKCETCHDSHGAALPKLLRAPEGDLCLDCHGGRKKGLKDETGRALIDIKPLVAKPVKHEPFEKGYCSDCHNPHGSDSQRLLSASHPAEFYAAYKDDAYQLCYSCHNKARITTQKTTSLTGFRDGGKNLHYVHVVKPENGRSCRVCHDDHATDNPHLIRSSVPYGPSGWELPIAYTASDKGGTCAKTCHEEKSYNNGGSRPQDIAAPYKKKRSAEVNAKKP